MVISYTNEKGSRPKPASTGDFSWIMCDPAPMRDGATRVFDRASIRCEGTKRCFGFETEMRPNFVQFLFCGIRAELEGERCKRSPALVKQHLEDQPAFEALGRFIVFRGWDQLEPSDTPETVVSFAPPDVRSGLFTLAYSDKDRPDGAITPFGSGCASIVCHPYQELQLERPRAVLGMFDVSARPCVALGILSFAVPWPKSAGVVSDVDERFLITRSWHRMGTRL